MVDLFVLMILQHLNLIEACYLLNHRAHHLKLTKLLRCLHTEIEQNEWQYSTVYAEGDWGAQSVKFTYCLCGDLANIFNLCNLYFIVETNAKNTGYFHLVQGSILKEIKPSYLKNTFSLQLFNPFQCLKLIKTRIR